MKLHVSDVTVFISKQLSKGVDSGEGNLINIADLSYSILKNRLSVLFPMLAIKKSTLEIARNILFPETIGGGAKIKRFSFNFVLFIGISID